MDSWHFVKMTAGVLATLGLYSVLYRENKFYRFFEHLFLGLAAGYSIVAFWTENLKEGWWDKMVGSSGPTGDKGYFLYALLLPIGIMGYFVFSKRHSWMSRVPIGMILGFWAGQQPAAFMNRFIPQIYDSMKPVVPTLLSPPFKPDTTNLAPDIADKINSNVYLSQAICNLITVVTLIAVMSYFLFSFDIKSKVMTKFTSLGRYLLMIGFGAIFGSTVMMRFALLIDRMDFIWIEWLKNTILHMK
jgi:hypothetical protein